MADMPNTPSSDVAAAGLRLKRKILVALGLCSVMPLLVLGYVTHSYVLRQINPTDTSSFFGILLLLLFTALAMFVGGFVIWDVGRAVSGMAQVLSDQGQLDRLGQRQDEAGTLIQTVARMLGTIEQQAAEINSFASRLDAAYKELENTNTRLKETSFKDEVTGLYNRRFFSIRLEEEMQRHRRFNHPVSVVLMDLDGFKAVNDELGHAVGDETLRDVAQILVKHSRGINVVARWGGDEFSVLLVETSRAGARLYADRIRQVVSTHPFAHGKAITASFGIASLPDDDARHVRGSGADGRRGAVHGQAGRQEPGGRHPCPGEGDVSIARKHVLLVDDDTQVREVLQQIFRSAGYECLMAPSGAEALAIFRVSRPPLTVTDLRMPGMDGVAVLRALRQLDPDAAVIVLTGAPEVKAAIDSLKLGADDFIVKPVNVDELLIAAERALERRQLLLERRQYQALLERRVEEATRDLQRAFQQLKDTYRATLETLGAALDSRDVGTEAHSRRVHGYAMVTAREHGVPRRAWGTSPTACSCTTSARSGYPMPSCSSPAP